MTAEQKEALLSKFGPLQTEAIISTFIEELNAVRTELSLPLVTDDRVYDGIMDRVWTLETEQTMKRKA